MTSTTCSDCVIDLVGSGPKDLKSSKIGVFFASCIGGAGVLLTVICVPFVTPALRRICLPFVPATNAQVSNVFKALEGRKGSLIDLGSGDGRLVLEAARRGFQAEGVELNPWLVVYSKLKAIRANLPSVATFKRGDIWKTNLKQYDNVVVFGVDCMMLELEHKFQSELQSGSRVVACRFPLPNATPISVIGHGIDKVWLYERPY